jgi:hypothetical protein
MHARVGPTSRDHAERRPSPSAATGLNETLDAVQRTPAGSSADLDGTVDAIDDAKLFAVGQ